MDERIERNGQARCFACAPLARLMEGLYDRAYSQYDAVIRAASELTESGALELLAGDCPLGEVDAVLRAERHFTVCHYLRCRSCGAVYFAGACIRGQPVFRREETLDEKKLGRLLWGRCGSYFDGR